MSWLITAVVVTGVSTAASARASWVAGKAQEIAINQQAEQERVAAQGAELQRRQQLNKVLASNIGSMAAGGLAGEGSPLSLSLESSKQASVSEGLASLSDRLQQAQLKRQASNAAAQGRIGAATTLLSGAASMAQMGAMPSSKGE